MPLKSEARGASLCRIVIITEPTYSLACSQISYGRFVLGSDHVSG